MGKARVEVEKCQHETAEIKTYLSHWHARHVKKAAACPCQKNEWEMAVCWKCG